MKESTKIYQKTAQMQIRVSLREKKLIREAANRANMNMSDWILKKLFPDLQVRFQELTVALNDSNNRRPALASLNDLFSATSADEFRLMTADSPQVPLSSINANYLAAMIEYAASHKKVKSPAWVFSISPLSAPYFGSNIKSLRLYLLTHSPAVFRRRNIFIDSSLGDRV